MKYDSPTSKAWLPRLPRNPPHAALTRRQCQVGRRLRPKRPYDVWVIDEIELSRKPAHSPSARSDGAR
jgi:hypothetical protein